MFNEHHLELIKTFNKIQITSCCLHRVSLDSNYVVKRFSHAHKHVSRWENCFNKDYFVAKNLVKINKGKKSNSNLKIYKQL